MKQKMPDLHRQICYFFSSKRRNRSDAHRFIGELLNHGRTAVVGGMLRDIGLFGNRNFTSDIDLVIDAHSLTGFHKFIREHNGEMNRFGGYSLRKGRWRIDVWALQETWAHVNGYASIKTIDDVRNVTFFTSDAILFDLTNKKIIADCAYFENIRNRHLDINLNASPNPLGNAIRAFRYALLKDFCWGSRLSSFVLDITHEYGVDALKKQEKNSYGTAYISTLDHPKLIKDLSEQTSYKLESWFDPRLYLKNIQLDLPLHLN